MLGFSKLAILAIISLFYGTTFAFIDMIPGKRLLQFCICLSIWLTARVQLCQNLFSQIIWSSFLLSGILMPEPLKNLQLGSERRDGTYFEAYECSFDIALDMCLSTQRAFWDARAMNN